jgi:uncharacterized protein (TIGR02246 family)
MKFCELMEALLQCVRCMILVLLLFIASAVWADDRSGDAKLDRAIEKANSEWAEAMKTGDAATIAAPYADDAVFVGFDGACIRGRSEIEKMYRARFDRGGFAVSTKIETRHVTVDGDLAYESGYAQIGRKAEGKTNIDGGRFLTVWQHRSGEWKIIHNLVLP